MKADFGGNGAGGGEDFLTIKFIIYIYIFTALV